MDAGRRRPVGRGGRPAGTPGRVPALRRARAALALGWYGWTTVVLGTITGCVLAGLYGLGPVLARRAGRRTAIPLGPFLVAGAFGGLLAGAYTAWRRLGQTRTRPDVRPVKTLT